MRENFEMKIKSKLDLLGILMLVSIGIFLVIGCANGASGPSSSGKITTEQTGHKDTEVNIGGGMTNTQEDEPVTPSKENPEIPPVDKPTTPSVEEPVNYTITFDSNGGIWSGESSQKIERGAIISEPQENPIKKGKSFAGWYVNGSADKPYDFNTLVTDSITLVAKFDNAKVGYIAYGDGSVSETVDSMKTGTMGPVGIVIEVTDGVATKIVALQESGELQMNKGSRNPRATSSSDGKANRVKIEEIQMRWSEYDQFPASEYCDDYVDASQNKEWYLPAINELQLLYNAKTKVNTALAQLGKQATLLSDKSYWSSTQNGSEDTGTWCISFENGEKSLHRHGLENFARPIRGF